MFSSQNTLHTTFTKYLFAFILATVAAKCTNMVHIEESDVAPYKRSSSIMLQSLAWKNRILNYNLGYEIYRLDFTNKELMLHASNLNKGVMIWRVCEKGTDYPEYGTINPKIVRGYTIQFRDQYNLDRFLSWNHFQTYGTSRRHIQETEQKKETAIEEKWRTDNPCLALLNDIIRLLVTAGSVIAIGLSIFGC